MKAFYKDRLLVVFIAVVIFFLGFSVRGLFPGQTKTSTLSTQPKNILLPEPEEGRYKVSKVLDGDTVVLETGEKFRYLGIDSPEPNERWGPEAKTFNEELVLNKKVRVELDLNKLDPYGRILGYLWVNNPSSITGGSEKEILVNEALVVKGYAKVSLIKGEAKPKYLDRLQKAESRARQNHDGVWFDEWTNKY